MPATFVNGDTTFAAAVADHYVKLKAFCIQSDSSGFRFDGTTTTGLTATTIYTAPVYVDGIAVHSPDGEGMVFNILGSSASGIVWWEYVPTTLQAP